ncbi:YraN family protein [candidate division KSB1 bacterium]|nr:YraN family protein [candidate division KSB1 bacterium]RQV99874.1 MAG: YraN family protein [candidate division KSB1 bacterium]
MFMSTFSKRVTGEQGEAAAARFLHTAGYKILARNYCTRDGEIDIIARHEDTLVFVEVKSTRTNTFGDPHTWVDERKQRRLGCAAEKYLLDNAIENVDCRFDVITVDFSRRPPHIEHTQDAFWLEE